MSEKFSNGTYKQHNYPLIIAMMDIKQALKIGVGSRISRIVQSLPPPPPVMYSTCTLHKFQKKLCPLKASGLIEEIFRLPSRLYELLKLIRLLCMYLEC